MAFNNLIIFAYSFIQGTTFIILARLSTGYFCFEIIETGLEITPPRIHRISGLKSQILKRTEVTEDCDLSSKQLPNQIKSVHYGGNFTDRIDTQNYPK